jgi:uncharacterized protein YdcH (DUF465 family)
MATRLSHEQWRAVYTAQGMLGKPRVLAARIALNSAKGAILKHQDTFTTPDRGEAMPVTHDLLADLKLDEDKFEALKKTDSALSQLHKDYLAKDKEVMVAEKNGTSDDTVNRLRKERALLKEKIVQHVEYPAQA